MVSDQSMFGTFIKLKEHPSSPVLLTKNGPLVNLIVNKNQVNQIFIQSPSEFENRSSSNEPESSNHLLYGL